MYKGDAGKLVIVVLQINSVYCRPNIAKTRGPIYKESLRLSSDNDQSYDNLTTMSIYKKSYDKLKTNL